MALNDGLGTNKVIGTGVTSGSAKATSQKVIDLEARVEKLEKMLEKSGSTDGGANFLQDDFSKKQVVKREVQFRAQVTDATGAVVIN